MQTHQDNNQILKLIDKIKPLFRHTVYVIESPSAEDLMTGHYEGKALTEALKLYGIKNKYFLVINNQMLDLCLNSIEKHRIIENNTFINLPIIHFSLHGNENGIILTSEKKELTWRTLGDKLAKINQRQKQVLQICMSSCYGYHGFKMAQRLTNIPFLFLVGPKEKLLWADALTAYITFYHHLQKSTFVTEETIKAMNIAAKVDSPIFNIAYGKSHQEQYVRELLTKLLKAFQIISEKK